LKICERKFRGSTRSGNVVIGIKFLSMER